MNKFYWPILQLAKFSLKRGSDDIRKVHKVVHKVCFRIVFTAHTSLVLYVSFEQQTIQISEALEEVRSSGCKYSLMRHKGLLFYLFCFPSGLRISRFPGFSYFLVKLTVVPKILARIQSYRTLDI